METRGHDDNELDPLENHIFAPRFFECRANSFDMVLSTYGAFHRFPELRQKQPGGRKEKQESRKLKSQDEN
jgi:hypothetical protein